MKILMVLTSHGELGNTGKKTGFWIEEFAAPYYVFSDAGAEITLASPKGGMPPIDPKSDEPDAQTPSTKRFKEDSYLKALLSDTRILDEMNADDYDAVFYPGGHGPLWDLENDENSIFLIEAFIHQQKPVAFVCHAPAALLNVKLEGGEYFIKGKQVTGFSNSEEEAVGLTKIVPYLLEDELKKKGGTYSKVSNWNSYVKTDGILVTGQNPGSSEEAAKVLLEFVKNKTELKQELNRVYYN